MKYINNFSEDHLISQNKFPSAGDGNRCSEYKSEEVNLAITSHQELAVALIQDTYSKLHNTKD